MTESEGPEQAPVSLEDLSQAADFPRLDPTVPLSEGIPEPVANDLDAEFPREWIKDFDGLAYLGYLSATVNDIPFHEFKMRTLLPGEKLEIVQICRDFEGSIGYSRAYRAAVVAASLTEVDGKPIIANMAPDKRVGLVRQKFHYIINTWFDPVVNILYRTVDELEGRQSRIMRDMLPWLQGNPDDPDGDSGKEQAPDGNS